MGDVDGTPSPQTHKAAPSPPGGPGSPTSERPGWALDGHWLRRGSRAGPLGPCQRGPCWLQVVKQALGSPNGTRSHRREGTPRVFLLYLLNTRINTQGFPAGAGGKEPTCQGRRHTRHRAVSRSGGSPGGGHGSPLQYPCMENPMDRGAW